MSNYLDYHNILYIHSDGKVGVNNSTPLATLSLASDQGNASGHDMIRMDSPDPTILFNDTTNTGSMRIRWQAGSGSSEGLRFFRDGDDGSNPQLMIDLNGRVGVGTDNPSSILELGGDPSPEITFNDTTAGHRGSLEFQDGNFSFWSDYTASGQVAGHATNNLTILRGGNVGIGTTSPDARLHVPQPSGTIGGADLSKAAILAGSTTAGIGIDDNEIIKKGSELVIGTADNNGITFKTNNNVNSTLMRLTSVGLGIDTTTPGARLHANESINGVNAGLLISNWNTTAGASQQTRLLFGLARNSGSLKSTAGEIRLGKEQDWTNDDATLDSYMAFNVYENMVSNERLRITSGGSVGIGTTSPDYKLHVNGADAMTGNWSKSLKLTATHPVICFAGSGDKYGFIGYDTASTTEGLSLSVAGTSDDRNSGTLGIKIDNTGNVGIGTNNPDYKLEVNGTGYFSDTVTFANAGVFQQGMIFNGNEVSQTEKHAGADFGNDYLLKDTSSWSYPNNTTKSNAKTLTFTAPDVAADGTRYYVKFLHGDSEGGARWTLNGFAERVLSYNDTPGNQDDNSKVWTTVDITDQVQTGTNTLYFWTATGDGVTQYETHVFTAVGLALPNEPVELKQHFYRGLTTSGSVGINMLPDEELAVAGRAYHTQSWGWNRHGGINEVKFEAGADLISIYHSSSDAYNLLQYGNETNYENFRAEFKFKVSSTETHLGFGFGGAASDPHNNMWSVVFRIDNNTVRLQKRVNGTQSYFPSSGYEVNPGINIDDALWHTVVVERMGCYIKVFVDGSLRINRSDFPLDTMNQGMVGLTTYRSNSDVHFRDFRIERLGANASQLSDPLHIRNTSVTDNADQVLLTLDAKFADNAIEQDDMVSIAFRLENSGGGSHEARNAISYGYNDRLFLQKGSGQLLIGGENNVWKYITTGANYGSSSAKVTIDASSNNNSGSFNNTNNALMLTSPASTYISFASKDSNGDNIRQGYIQGVEGQGMRIANDSLHSITDQNAWIDINQQHIYMRSSNNAEPLATLYIDELNNHGGIVVNAAGNQTHLRFQDNGSLKWQVRCPFHHTSDNPDSMRFYSWTNGGDVMTLKNNGHVGIGISDPQAPLHVYDSRTGNSEPNILVDGPANTERAIVFAQAGAQKWWMGVDNTGDMANDHFGLWNQAQSSFLIACKSSNRVGIGGTTTPQSTLTLGPYGATDGTKMLGFAEGSGESVWFESGFLATNDDNYICLNSGSTTLGSNGIMTWKLGGKVGIGTKSPDSTLHVKRTVTDTSTEDLLTLETYRGDITSAGGVSLSFISKDSNNGTGSIARIKSMASNTDNTFGDTSETSSHLVFETGYQGTQSNKMTITGRGDVGIGTMNPDTRLQVSSTTNAAARFNSQDGSFTNWLTIGCSSTTAATKFTSSTDGFHFDTGDPDGGTYAMVINQKGDVGLGTSTPAAKFEVIGDNGQLFSVVDDMSGVIFSVNDSSGIPSIEVEDDGTVTLAEFGGKVFIGTPTYTAALVNVGGTIDATAHTTNSDRALKNNIEPIVDAVDKVKQIGGYTFDMTTTGRTSTGVIAQEVEQVLPQVVFGEEGEKSVSYGNMVGLLIEAIKEQQQTIEAQQARIEALEQHIK